MGDEAGFVTVYRELCAATALAVASLAVFAVFFMRGWPGAPHECLAERRCYCEAVDEAQLGAPGARQPMNTASAVVPILLGLGLGWRVGRDRVRGGRAAFSNRMSRADSLYPLLYVLVVVALGPGSMFLHASMTRWGGVMDNLSMYLFVNFLLCYGLVRLWAHEALFVVGYPLLTIGFVGWYAWVARTPWLVSVATLPATLVEARLILRGTPADYRWYVAAVVVFTTGFGIWLASNDGGPLCDPHSWAQGHALWHVLAGATAVLLFQYYRSSGA